MDVEAEKARLLQWALERAAARGRNNAGFDLACQVRDRWHAAGISEEDARSAALDLLNDFRLSAGPAPGAPYTGRDAAASVRQAFRRPARESGRGNAGARIRRPGWLKEPPPADPDSPQALARIEKGLRPLPEDARAYLAGRGIDPELAISCGVRFHPDIDGQPCVCFPLRDRAGLRAYGARAIHGTAKRAIGAHGSAVFFTSERIGETLAIAEAPIDALTLAQAGLPCIALWGTSYPAWLPAALRFRTVYIATDADPAGDTAAAQLTAALQAYGATVRRLRPEGGKDWNEALQSCGRAALAECLRTATKQAEPAPPPSRRTGKKPGTAPQPGGRLKTAAQAARTTHAAPPDVSEDPPDLLPGEAEINAALAAGLITQEVAEAALSDLFAGHGKPAPAPTPPRSAYADRQPDPDAAAVEELRLRILSALENTRALRSGETVTDPERYAAREAADALNPYPALAIGARARLAALGITQWL